MKLIEALKVIQSYGLVVSPLTSTPSIPIEASSNGITVATGKGTFFFSGPRKDLWLTLNDAGARGMLAGDLYKHMLRVSTKENS